jgi:hypothetical protein
VDSSAAWFGSFQGRFVNWFHGFGEVVAGVIGCCADLDFPTERSVRYHVAYSLGGPFATYRISFLMCALNLVQITSIWLRRSLRFALNATTAPESAAAGSTRQGESRYGYELLSELTFEGFIESSHGSTHSL